MPAVAKDRITKISRISENARTIMGRIHLLRAPDGSVCETPEECFRRVAKAVAAVEPDPVDRRHYEELFFEMMADLRFLPNTPTLSNAGQPNGQLSACFVLPVEDSMDRIFDSVKAAALVHKSGGGTGFTFDHIREAGALVRSTNGTASGPLSYMRVFDEQTETIKQAGTRRGANMGCLSVDHPDIYDFIACKDRPDDCPHCGSRPPLSNFNISVKLNDEFMAALERGDTKWPLISRIDGSIAKTVDPRALFRAIAEQAWKNGEPGVLFIDRINDENPTPGIGRIEATNPCWTGDTLVVTRSGAVPFRTLVGREVEVLTRDQAGRVTWAMMRNIRCTRETAEVHALKIRDGYTLRPTPDHNLYLAGGRKVAVSDLVAGDILDGARMGCCTEGCESVAAVVDGVLTSPDHADVYNGTVDGYHRYFVKAGDGRMILSANCGEQPLLPYEACNLGSINLTQFLTDAEGGFAPGVSFSKLETTTHLAVRFLDNVIDASCFPIPQIAEMVRRNRKTGLGVMGLAELLIELRIPYGSEEAVALGEQIMETIRRTALEASRDLAAERGSFPSLGESVYADDPNPPRNAARTTIAPTGTISRVFECSSGIEPIFALRYVKSVVGGPDLVYLDKSFVRWIDGELRANRISRERYDEILAHVEETGSIRDLDYIPEQTRRVFRISQEIPASEHLAMQAAFQRHIENAVSKTVVFPNDATIEDIERAYLDAYKAGLKGVTVYRVDSRERQAMVIGSGARGGTPQAAAAILNVRRRPTRLAGGTTKIQTGCGKLYVTLNSDEYGIAELFAALGKSGGCAQAQMQAIGKLASVAMRAGVGADEIADMLRGIRCSTVAFGDYGPVTSCADAVAKVIEMELGLREPSQDEPDVVVVQTAHNRAILNGFGVCPECSSPMVEESGCATCSSPSCGYSRCG